MSFHRARPRPTAPLLACAAGLLLALLAGAPALAQDGAYTVGGIPVDASAETATIAREKAIAEGQSLAVAKLFDRLVLEADRNRLPPPTPDQITELVQGFSVANERSTTGRYLADFTVRFRKDLVRQLFQAYRVRFAEAESRPLLVFPVYGPVAGGGGEAVLWEEPNPWRLAWAKATGRGGLIPVEVPLGDLSDMSAVGAEQALAGSLERLRALADRYGTPDLLVAHARLDGDPESGTAALRVESRRGTPDGLGQGPAASFQQEPGEDLEALLARGVEATVAALETAWKQQNALDFSTRSNLLVSVRFGSLAELAEVQRRLGQVPSILTRSVSLLKRDRADLVLTVVGSLSQLGTALAQKDLILDRPEYGTGATAGGTAGTLGQPAPAQWTLRLGSGAEAAAGAGGFSFDDLARQAQPMEEGAVERLDDDAALPGASGSGSGATAGDGPAAATVTVTGDGAAMPESAAPEDTATE